MTIKLVDIEELKLSKTEELIINLFEYNREQKITILEIPSQINVILPTIIKAIRKLVSKNIISEDNNEIYLLDFGNKILNYYSFRNNILLEFCVTNNISRELYNSYIRSGKYNNMPLLLGMKNLLTKEVN